MERHAAHSRLLTEASPFGAVSRTEMRMGTFVTMQVLPSDERHDPAGAALDRAFGWFAEVERCCSRFDASSELRGLVGRIDEAIPLSEMLFAGIQFALAVAEDTDGAFDPTVGIDMERRGFNRHYATGAEVSTCGADHTSYRDVRLDANARTVTIRKPLLLDLGAVAKGLAIDMAALELRPFGHFAIDAGGDLYVSGSGPSGGSWTIGVRHPRDADALLTTLHVADVAVCTSGDYERGGTDAGHHIVDARTRTTADRAVSATAIAPTALAADALATAAFVLGPRDGIALLERHGAAGLIVTPQLDRYTTKDLGRYA